MENEVISQGLCKLSCKQIENILLGLSQRRYLDRSLLLWQFVCCSRTTKNNNNDKILLFQSEWHTEWAVQVCTEDQDHGEHDDDDSGTHFYNVVSSED